MQDKSSSVGVHTLRMLMNDGDDVMHVNVGSGITTAHIASIANSADTTISVFGIQSDKQRQQIIHNLERFGCRCIFLVVLCCHSTVVQL